MSTHPAESSDWTNVLIAQILQGYRNDLLSDGGEEGARQRIEKLLNPESGAMSWLVSLDYQSCILDLPCRSMRSARLGH